VESGREADLSQILAAGRELSSPSPISDLYFGLMLKHPLLFEEEQKASV